MNKKIQVLFLTVCYVVQHNVCALAPRMFRSITLAGALGSIVATYLQRDSGDKEHIKRVITQGMYNFLPTVLVGSYLYSKTPGPTFKRAVRSYNKATNNKMFLIMNANRDDYCALLREINASFCQDTNPVMSAYESLKIVDGELSGAQVTYSAVMEMINHSTVSENYLKKYGINLSELQTNIAKINLFRERIQEVSCLLQKHPHYFNDLKVDGEHRSEYDGEECLLFEHSDNGDYNYKNTADV